MAVSAIQPALIDGNGKTGNPVRVAGHSRSVVLGQEDAGARPVGLGDDPELDSVPVAIDRKDPQSATQGHFVFLAVFGACVAPVGGGVPLQAFPQVFGIQRFKCGGGADHLA